TRRQGVVDGEAALGDADLVAGVEHLPLHPRPVDLDPVGAVQVAEVPVAFHERQLAVATRHVRVVQADVARLPPADPERIAERGDGTAAAAGNESTVGFKPHGRCSLAGSAGLASRPTRRTERGPPHAPPTPHYKTAAHRTKRVRAVKRQYV